MLITPTGLTVVYIFFYIFSMAAGLGRDIIIENRRILNSIGIMKALCEYRRMKRILHVFDKLSPPHYFYLQTRILLLLS